MSVADKERSVFRHKPIEETEAEAGEGTKPFKSLVLWGWPCTGSTAVAIHC